MPRVCFTSVAAVAVIILTSGFSHGDDTYTIDLASLLGDHSRADGVVRIKVDASRTFSTVSDVRIQISGFAQSGRCIAMDGSDRQHDVPVSVGLQLSDNAVSWQGPEARLGPYHQYFSDERKFYLRRRDPELLSSWSFLHDGKWEMRLYWRDDVPDGCQYVEQPMVEIQEAHLIVEGETAN